MLQGLESKMKKWLITTAVILSTMSAGYAAVDTKQGVFLTQNEIDQSLFECRSGTDWGIKEQNIQKLVGNGKKSVPTLIECLKWQLPERFNERFNDLEKKQPVAMRGDRSSLGIQYCSEMALIKIGSPGVPYLLQSIDTQPETIAVVARILGEIGDGNAIPALIKILQEEKLGFWNRALAAQALQKLHAKEAVPSLIKALKGQPDDPYNNAKFLNYIADALAKLSSQSYGFTFVPEADTKGKAGVIPEHFVFTGSDEDRAKIIQKWEKWLKETSK